MISLHCALPYICSLKPGAGGGLGHFSDIKATQDEDEAGVVAIAVFSIAVTTYSKPSMVVSVLREPSMEVHVKQTSQLRLLSLGHE